MAGRGRAELIDRRVNRPNPKGITWVGDTRGEIKLLKWPDFIRPTLEVGTICNEARLVRTPNAGPASRASMGHAVA